MVRVREDEGKEAERVERGTGWWKMTGSEGGKEKKSEDLKRQKKGKEDIAVTRE